jgi:hypothetical protein
MLDMRRAALAATAALVLVACGSSGSSPSAGGGGSTGGENQVVGDADEGIDGVQAIRVADNTHTESIVDYQLRPPAGGAHNPVWWNCGFYDEPIPDEHAVHDLEHGVVWIAYDPDLPSTDVDGLHDLARSNPRLLVTPYPDLPDGTAVVATAWARQLTLTSATDHRLAAFVDRYVDGSQAPEAGASCTGSPLGQPVP